VRCIAGVLAVALPRDEEPRPVDGIAAAAAAAAAAAVVVSAATRRRPELQRALNCSRRGSGAVAGRACAPAVPQHSRSPVSALHGWGIGSQQQREWSAADRATRHTPRPRARGWARPHQRPAKNQSCFRLGVPYPLRRHEQGFAARLTHRARRTAPTRAGRWRPGTGGRGWADQAVPPAAWPAPRRPARCASR
jgi:hypothetical protein